MKFKFLASPHLKHIPHSGVKGITWHKQSRSWLVQKTVNGSQNHIGHFKDLDQAKDALTKFMESL